MIVAIVQFVYGKVFYMSEMLD